MPCRKTNRDTRYILNQAVLCVSAQNLIKLLARLSRNMDTNTTIWDEKFKTGVEFMDVEHKQLFDLIEDCIQATRSNEAKERIIGLLNKIASHLACHFENEENAMRSASDHQFDQHRAQHKYILEKVNSRISHLCNNDTAITAQDILYVLYGWYIAHNASEDKKLADFLRDIARTANSP